MGLQRPYKIERLDIGSRAYRAQIGQQPLLQTVHQGGIRTGRNGAPTTFVEQGAGLQSARCFPPGQAKIAHPFQRCFGQRFGRGIVPDPVIQHHIAEPFLPAGNHLAIPL